MNSSYSKPAKLIKRYTANEEIANSITHGVGLLASVYGLYLLTNMNLGTEAILVAWIFGVSMILCYATSTFYHLAINPVTKLYLKIADHSAIYLLIAGTYTPFAIYVVGGNMGYMLLVVIWSLALIGMVFKLFYVNRFQLLSTYIYLGMGWMAILVIRTIIENLHINGIWLMVAGGLSYSIGVIFFLKEKLPYSHAIWHIFVLIGTVCHFLCVWLYVMPKAVVG